MLDLKTINLVLGEFEERGISKETMIDAIEQAMATAYKKEYGKRGQVIRGMLDMNTGTVSFEQVKTIVDETMVRFPEPDEEIPEPHPHHEHDEVVEGELPRYDGEKHMLLEDAKRIKRDLLAHVHADSRATGCECREGVIPGHDTITHAIAHRHTWILPTIKRLQIFPFKIVCIDRLDIAYIPVGNFRCIANRGHICR